MDLKNSPSPGRSQPSAPDLVARLRYCRICNGTRELAGEPCPRCSGSIELEAAAEIERLRASQNLMYTEGKRFESQWREAAEDNERLRAALEEYGQHHRDCPRFTHHGDCNCGFREALRGEKK